MSPTRPHPRARRCAAAIALAALACGGPAAPLPPLDARAGRMVDGLDGAAALALLPDGRIAVAEPRAGSGGGAVRLLDPRRPDGAATRLEIFLAGPAGVAVDPDFPSNRRLWITGGRVVAAVEADGTRRIRGRPSAAGGAETAGSGDAVAVIDLPGPAGPVAAGPDGRVYVGIPADDRFGALRGRRREARGVVVRLNPEGTVPVDNPRGPRDPVWASGLAAPAGLDVDPDGSVWVADPAAGRVVRLGPGEDAGWPLVRGRADSALEWLAAREIGPAFRAAAWTPDRGAPLSVVALRSAAWGATAAVGLDDGRIVRLRMQDPAAGPRAGPLVDGLGGPVVGLAEGADGRLWALTPSAVWRIDPPGATPFDAARGVRADTLTPSPRSY